MYVYGLSAHIAGYDVEVLGNFVSVRREGTLVTRQEVPHLCEFVRKARTLSMALADFGNFEVIYLFDPKQDNYGFAVNLKIPEFSEWGQAPLSYERI